MKYVCSDCHETFNPEEFKKLSDGVACPNCWDNPQHFPVYKEFVEASDITRESADRSNVSPHRAF